MIRCSSRATQAADGDAEVEPLEPPGLLGGDAGAGVEPQPTGGRVDEEIEEGLAVEVGHHRLAELVHKALGIVGREQPAPPCPRAA